VFGIDLEGLGLSHDEPDHGSLHVLEQLDGTHVQLCFPMDTRRNTEAGVSYLDKKNKTKNRSGTHSGAKL
jgi:hypothetical protein